MREVLQSNQILSWTTGKYTTTFLGFKGEKKGPHAEGERNDKEYNNEAGRRNNMKNQQEWKKRIWGEQKETGKKATQ